MSESLVSICFLRRGRTVMVRTGRTTIRKLACPEVFASSLDSWMFFLWNPRFFFLCFRLRMTHQGRPSYNIVPHHIATRLVRVRTPLESSPSRAPVAPPGRPAGPPTHPYHPTGRPYVGILPDSTTTWRTKFHTRTQSDGVGIKHADNVPQSGLNGVSML